MNKGILIVTILGSMTIIVMSEGAEGRFPEPPTIIAWLGSYIVISAVGEFAPNIGNGLAMLLFLSILFARGLEAFEGINRYTLQQKKGKRSGQN